MFTRVLRSTSYLAYPQLRLGYRFGRRAATTRNHMSPRKPPSIRPMIPTLLMLGLAFALALGGRGLWVVPLAALGWAFVVPDANAASAILVAGLNTLVGAAAGLAIRWPIATIAR